ncbi:MAG: hypothetical protein ACTSRS_22415 [Candidatus Helarchaeota archaeon]
MRNEDLEFYGRCPICKRNDRVEKVSAIYQNKSISSSLASRIKPPIEPILDGKSEIYLTNSLSLPKLYIRVVEGVYPDDYSIAGVGILIFMISLFFLCLTFGKIDGPTVPIFLISCIGIVISILMIKIGKKRKKTKIEENKLRKINNAKKMNEWQIAANALHDNWEIAYIRWEKCYYCHRDDVVFIPGESNVVSPSGFVEYLFKGIKKD